MADLDGLELIFDIVELLIDIFADSKGRGYHSSSYKKSQNDYGAKPIFKDVGSMTSGKYQEGNTSHTNYDKAVKTTHKPNQNNTSKTIIQPMKDDVKSISKPLGFNIHRIKLEIMLLGYLYQEDDGKVSGKEKREIKRHFNKYKNKLDDEDIKEIRSLSGMDSSLMNIRALISQNDVSESDIARAISVVRDINRVEDKYNDIIKRVERALLESMGY